MDNPGYDQLHCNPTDTLLASRQARFDTLLCEGRRPVLTLDGRWTGGPDVYDNGIRARWYEEAGGEFDRRAPKDYDFEAMDPVTVPSCWNNLAREYSLYEGGFWYFRTFEAPTSEPGERLVLRFGAANYAALVFVNGVHVASHEGGFTPFCADVTDVLRPAANRLHVWVSNARRRDAVPSDYTDWFNYGGLYRSVELFRVPEVRVDDWALSVELSESGKRIRLRLALNRPVEADVRLRFEGLLEAEARTGPDGRLDASWEADPELWSPESPRLYPVEVSCGEDRLEDEIGFRKVEIRGTKVFLNGREIFLRGVAVHEEGPDGSRTLSEGDIALMLDHVRRMNGNFLRLAHYPHSEAVAKMADRAGVMLWEEIPVYWALDFSNPATLANAVNQLEELMKRDRNRASVVVWAVGNENPDTDERFAFMRSLIEAVRRRDPERLVAAACLVDLVSFEVTDRLAPHLDIIGINEYFGWYYYGYENLSRLLGKEYDRPVVVSEFGAEAVPGLHGDSSEIWTEEYQAEVYRNQLERILASRAAGVVPWILYDFRTPRRLNPRQRMNNLKGLVDRSRTHMKEAFHLVSGYYETLKENGR